MQNEQYKASDGTIYVRINRMRARNYYGSGKTILLVPDGVRLENAWDSLKPISLYDNPEDKRNFDRRVDDYVVSKRPTLRNKKFVIAFSNNRII